MGAFITEGMCLLYLCPDVTAIFRYARENTRGVHAAHTVLHVAFFIC